MKKIKPVTLILLALIIALAPLPCHGGQAEICAVLLQKTTLKDLQGSVKTELPAFTPLKLIAPKGPDLHVISPAAEKGRPREGYIPASSAVLVPGRASSHKKRLLRIKKTILPQKEKIRLAKGIIRKGDTFPLVEMAWGKPQRSFMVNYFSDEEHYVYFRPEGKVLLRFKGGFLSPPLPEKHSDKAKP